MVISTRPKAGLDFFAKLLISTLLLVWLSVVMISPVDAKPAFSAIAVDARTGKILYANNADSKRYPASMTKMMTLYLLFEDIKARRISMNSPIRMSRYAASRPPSKLGIRAGRSIRVRDAILSLVTKSANDVATAIGENLEGSEKRFARRMTKTARRIGMTRTTFRNASGLPDRRQMTTARDMATLGLRLQRDFPRYYKFFAIKRFSYAGRRYGSSNKLLGRIQGVDGIKTGYTRASGFNLTSSARRGKKRIVAVVMGGRTGKARNRYMTALIKRMFAKKRLASSTRIASVAGSPPGYKRVRSNTRLAAVYRAPLPRKKPIIKMVKKLPVEKSPIEKRVVKKPIVLAEKQQDRIVPVKPTVSSVSTFKTARIVDDKGQPEIAPFKNDIGSSSVASGGKSDRILPRKVIITAVASVAEKTMPKVDPHSSTWNIQIGAFPSQKSAKGRLANATAKASRNLRGKVAFTVEVRKNGSKFYRARFAGFNRKSATRACRTLSRKGFGCFALAPRS